MVLLTPPAKADAITNVGTESFRLSAFVQLLSREGEVEAGRYVLTKRRQRK
jgi:hypothetical protein